MGDRRKKKVRIIAGMRKLLGDALKVMPFIRYSMQHCKFISSGTSDEGQDTHIDVDETPRTESAATTVPVASACD
jgi:hypothetical protein